MTTTAGITAASSTTYTSTSPSTPSTSHLIQYISVHTILVIYMLRSLGSLFYCCCCCRGVFDIRGVPLRDRSLSFGFFGFWWVGDVKRKRITVVTESWRHLQAMSHHIAICETPYGNSRIFFRRVSIRITFPKYSKFERRTKSYIRYKHTFNMSSETVSLAGKHVNVAMMTSGGKINWIAVYICNCRVVIWSSSFSTFSSRSSNERAHTLSQA